MYKHGAYADLMATKDFIPPQGVATLPVYIGTAPINQLSVFSNTINKPLLIQSYQDGVNKIGYNEDWTNFTLCEALYAHFKNNIQPIGPIVVINVLDPATHKKAGTATVAMTNGIGYIDNKKVILNSVEATTVGVTIGTDFTVEYSTDGEKVIVKALTATVGASLDLSFDEIDMTNVTGTTIIGGTDANGIRTGIDAIDLIYQTFNMIPTIFAAPGWSHIEDVDTALKSKSQKFNGHWFAWVNSDIDSDTTTTITAAKTAKNTNGFIGVMESPCWPMAYKGVRKFHISTLATVTMQMVDFQNDNVPYETPSNKPVDISGMCLKDGSVIEIDQTQANDLNSKGIRTLTFWGGRWILWGSHTGDYEYGKDMDKRNVFDSNIRMIYYVANTFQSRYGTLVDKPMNRALVDTILNDFQEWFDNLAAQGRILFGEITFTEIDNPITDVVEGDFDFNIETTTTPPGKSLTAKISWTTQGINVLFGGEE
jgi:phage tail sheath protein FI